MPLALETPKARKNRQMKYIYENNERLRRMGVCLSLLQENKLLVIAFTKKQVSTPLPNKNKTVLVWEQNNAGGNSEDTQIAF